MPKKDSRLIFLSHVAAEKALAEAFETLLTKWLGITSARIFCSSLEGQGVPKGTNFVDAIRKEVGEAKVVIALISPAYLDSAFCMAELGAAWVLGTQRYPIVVPPNTFKVIDATMLGLVAVKIDEEHALSQLLEELGKALGLDAPAAGVRGRAMEGFLKTWLKLRARIAKAKRVEGAVHDETVEKLKKAKKAKEVLTADLTKARAHIAALEKLKDAAKVAEVADEFADNDWEDEFDDAMSEIHGLISEVESKSTLRFMILEILGKPSIPDLNSDDIARAVELDIFDPETRQWNHGSDEMSTLANAIRRVESILEESDEAIAALKKRGRRTNPGDIRFWEENIR